LTVDEIRILEVAVRATRRKERWLAESFWLLPQTNAGLDNLLVEIKDAIFETGKAILEPPDGWTIKFNVQSRTLRGPAAQAMRHYLNRVGGGSLPRVSWTPVDDRWTLTERTLSNG
jgi:hypothetical protein